MTFYLRNPSNRTCRFIEMWQDQRATAAVEFALTATALMFLLMAATDLALAIRTQKEVGNAARAGTEYAAIKAGQGSSYSSYSSGIATAVTSATSLSATATSTSYCGCATASGITTQTCGSACSAGGTTGTYVSVTAQGSYSPLFSTRWNQYLVSGLVNMSVTETTRTN
jgi:Flp pilus assembly protein TadG